MTEKEHIDILTSTLADYREELADVRNQLATLQSNVDKARSFLFSVSLYANDAFSVDNTIIEEYVDRMPEYAKEWRRTPWFVTDVGKAISLYLEEIKSLSQRAGWILDGVGDPYESYEDYKEKDPRAEIRAELELTYPKKQQ